MSNESITSVHAEENWKVLGGNPSLEISNNYNLLSSQKMRPRKFMNAFPGIERIWNNRKLRSNLNTFLVNGNKCTPIKILKNRFIIQNTCAFDSIAIIIVMAYYDNLSYKKYIDACENDLSNFCKNLAINGPSKEIYKLRATILKSIFEVSMGITGVSIIYATCNVSYIVSQL